MKGKLILDGKMLVEAELKLPQTSKTIKAQLWELLSDRQRKRLLQSAPGMNFGKVMDKLEIQISESKKDLEGFNL